MAQPADSVSRRPIGIAGQGKPDTSQAHAGLPGFKSGNQLLNLSGEPVPYAISLRNYPGKEYLFYLLTGLVMVLAFLRFFYPRYFSNLFRVFFNTSLRQSQLTDQLLQAKLPSLFYNLFFIISGGLFSYLLLSHFHWIDTPLQWRTAAICIGVLGVAYSMKYATLKFTGWITGYTDPVNTYIFIVFLISKIIGIILVPIIILLAFSAPQIAQVAVTASLLMIAFMLLLRFVRSYSILQYQLKISRYHFLLYILGVEILPILLVYKGLMVLLDKYL